MPADDVVATGLAADAWPARVHALTERRHPIGRPGRRRLHAVAAREELLLASRAIENDDLGDTSAAPTDSSNAVAVMRPARLVPLLVEPARRERSDATAVHRHPNESRPAGDRLHGDDLAVAPGIGNGETLAPR